MIPYTMAIPTATTAREAIPEAHRPRPTSYFPSSRGGQPRTLPTTVGRCGRTSSDSSFYSFDVEDITANKTDHFIFLDSANGTLGEEQVKLIEEGVLDGPDDDDEYRYTFVFTHTNIFRPSSWQFASTYAREETYYLLEKFTEWKVTAVFMGHVHAWDERMFGDAYYITLDSMSEDNSPDPGDYLVRITVHSNSDEGIDIEKVHLSYTKKN